MKSTTELDALAHIIRQIKGYSHRKTANREETLRAFLKHQLSTQDWEVWQNLLPHQQASFVCNQDKLPDNSVAYKAFQLLLSQYKRAGFELAESWYQAQRRVLAP